MSAKFLPAVLLTVALGASAQTDSTVLTVTIRPAVSLTLAGQAIGIKIRLAPESAARVWRSEDCARTPADGYTISRSGTFAIPLDAIAGRGGRVCLASSDGSLVSSVALVP